MSRRAVFLDRDGVINRAIVRDGRPYPPRSLAELEILPEVPESLNRFRSAGLRQIIVTNQPDIRRGILTQQTVGTMHNFLLEHLPLDSIRVCAHDDLDQCQCRKPAPGMLLDAAMEDQINLAASFMIGDRWRDVEAGRQAGCKTILIDYGYREALRSEPDVRVRSLAEAADWILSQMSTG